MSIAIGYNIVPLALTEQENALKQQDFGCQENRATVMHRLEKNYFYFINRSPMVYSETTPSQTFGRNE